MPAVVHGIKSKAITQSGESGSITKTGIDCLTRVEKIPLASFPALLRSIYSPHPRYRSMGVASATWECADAGQFYTVTYKYEGYLSTPSEQPTYSLSGTLSESDIRLHPKILSLIGTPSNPKNGAIFLDPATGKPTKDNSLGVFKEFPATINGDRNPKGGVEAYMVPGLIWQKTYISNGPPDDVTRIGRKDTPEGPCPSVSPRNWMLWEVSYTRRGQVYQITKSWRMSDRNGWDSDIY